MRISPLAVIIAHMMKRTLPLLMLAIAVLACSLQGTPEPIYITATPQGYVEPTTERIVITATPQPTSTLAPVVTPTLPPLQGMGEADKAIHNGDYELAVNTYSSVLGDQFLDANLRAEAAYNLGQAAVREGLFQEAADSLTQFINSFPTDARLPQAYFLRGEAYLGLSSWALAITDFQKYLELRPGIIDSYVHERIADAQTNLGLTQEALVSYEQAANANRDLNSQIALREKLAAAFINMGLTQQAVDQYDAILTQAQNGEDRASIEYQAAQLEIAMGQTERGYARLSAMIAFYPSTRSAYLGMLDLLNAGIAVDDWLRARISFAAEDYQDALTALNRYTTTVAVAPVEALLMLGRAYRAVGNYPAAYTTFQTIIDQYKTDPTYTLAWLEQGRTLFMENNLMGAINRYIELAAQNPQAPEAPDALWRAGYLYTQINDPEAAMRTFETLGSTYPGTERAQEGLLLGATIAYNQGQLSRAQAFYIQLANTGSGTNRAQAFLWLGRLYQQEGNTDLAVQSYTGAAQAAPGDYFSIRADDLLNNREPFTPPAGYRFEFDEATEQAEAEQWLRTTYQIQSTEPLSPLNPTLRADQRLIRGSELWELGELEAARTEFYSLFETYENDALACYQLSMYFRDIGLYRLSIESAARVIDLSGVSTLDAPRFLARLRYPVYYKDLVLPEAEKWEVDPLLVFSLIRQESLYEGFATSFAYAQGLMQIIPDTGWEIYGRLGWPEGYQNSDVYRPYVNVPFGVFYLDWVKDYVDDVPYAALAGYNGGPGNAYEWLSISGPDIDLFIQTVAFDETKLYVERIYEQYTIYRELYGTE